MKVDQPSAVNPTNKLTAAMVGVAIMEVLRLLAINFLPSFYDPGVWAALNPLAVILAGYFIRDHATTVNLTPEQFREVKDDNGAA